MVTIFNRRGMRRLSIDERCSLLVEHMKKSGDIAPKKYQELTNIERAQAAKDFTEFIKRGLIKRIGKGRNIKYILK